MNLAWRALLFGLCIQLGLGIAFGLTGLTPAIIQEKMDMKDPSELVETWQWGGSGGLIGDVMAGLRFFWDINVPFIESTMILAKNMGCPLIILDPLKAIWRFIWNTFVIEMISGRRIMYD